MAPESSEQSTDTAAIGLVLAVAFTVIFVLTVLLSLAVVVIRPEGDSVAAREWLHVVLPIETSLLGSFAGFHLGKRTSARERRES